MKELMSNIHTKLFLVYFTLLLFDLSNNYFFCKALQLQCFLFSEVYVCHLYFVELELVKVL
jgi:hypothetical protein